MITKRNTLICDICGLFCKYYDEWTPFGCADPEDPEPYDPSHICKKCFPSVKAEWKERLKKNHRIGDYQKSRAEMEAAEELGLVWVGSSGVGTLGTKDFSEHYYYLPKAEYDRLKALPYWGYCKKCKTVRKGGYCSDSKCSESFEAKSVSQNRPYAK